jgi:predicted phage terminase large subunit-like protein
VIDDDDESLELLRSASRMFDEDTVGRCSESLMEFCRWCWPIIDPGMPLIEGRVMDAIALHLEAVFYGSIKRLLITVPPGCSKSSLTSVLYPLWVWGPKESPWYRFVGASYSVDLPIRDNGRCRRIAMDANFKRLWPHVELQAPNTPVKFENTATGWKLATSTSGTGIGLRATQWLIDDPNKTGIRGVESDAERRAVGMWFRETVPTRLENMETGAIVVIQQRVHMGDVAGICMESGDYVHLNLPMEYEERVYCNAYLPDDSGQIATFIDDDAMTVPHEDVFWHDWRHREGDLLWPERFSASVLKRLKADMGPTSVAAMFQQRPIPRGGAIIKREYWQLFEGEKFPPFDFVLASVDTAYTEKRTNDPSAMTIWGCYREAPVVSVSGRPLSRWQEIRDAAIQQTLGEPRMILLYAWQDWLAFHDLVERVIDTCTPMKGEALRFPVDVVLIEGKASGISVAQELYRLLGHSGKFGVELVDPDGDKRSRLSSIEHVFAQGVISAPDKTWAEMVIDQMSQFPYGNHDDLVDSASMAIRWCRDHQYALTREEHAEEYAAVTTYKPKLVPLYGQT